MIDRPSMLAPLLARPAEETLFVLPDLTAISYGRIRAMAAHLAGRIEGDPVLHSKSAASCVATFLAAALCGRRVSMPASIAPAYLDELGLGGSQVIGDDMFDGAPLPRWAELPDDTALDLPAALPDLAIDIFTSGSTSKPERIPKHLSQLEIEAAALDRLWGAEAGHVLATVSPLHIYGLLFRIAWPILSRRTADDQAAAFWEQIVGRMGPGTTLISSPAHLSRLPPIDFGSSPPDLIFSSGQLLTTPDAAAARAAFGREVTEVLGNTLTGGVAWRRQGADGEMWTPFAGIMPEIGEDHALLVRSPYLPDDRPYPTGDRVRLEEDGRFVLLGRADRMEKVAGHRVSLNRVEAAFDALPPVERARILTLPDRDNELAAAIILTEEGRAALAEQGRFAFSRALRRAARATLESHELPKHWRFEQAFPRNAQGKEQVAQLRALFARPPLSLADVEVEQCGPDHAVIALRTEPAWPWFRGHFDAFGVLAGLAQTYIAATLAKQLWGWWPSGGTLRRVKFMRIVEPNRDMRIELKRDAARGTLWMRWTFADGSPATQGEIGGA